MRRTFALIVLIAVVISLAHPVHATTENYEIPEMDLDISIPSEYDVFTRDMDKNDPLFKEYNITKEDLVKQFTSDNIYLDAVSSDGSEEIVITMADNIISEFNGMGDTELLILASALEKEFAGYGISISSYDIYHHSQLVFVRFYFNSTDKSVYGLQYYSIYNNKAMNFTLRSYDGPISTAQEKTIQTVVDSIDVHSYKPAESHVQETPAFVYTDKDTGTSFTVPANWTEAEFTKEREVLDAKFSSKEDPGLMIMYSSTDLWGELSLLERMFVSWASSEELLSSLSTADIAESYGIPESSISTKTYGGKDYYIFDTSYSTDMYGTTFSMPITAAVHIENGWAYMFQFSTEKDSTHYNEFEKLLKSVEYGNKSTAGEGNIFFVVLLVIVIVIVAIILIIVTRKKKKFHKKAAAITINEPITPIPPANQTHIYCHLCGNKLPADSSFCNVCGTRLIK